MSFKEWYDSSHLSVIHCLKNLYIYGTTLIIAEGNVP